jgi:cysteine-rich repeat protein
LAAVCGDGIVQAGEQCDDKNTDAGDICSSTCTWETVSEIEPNSNKADADAAAAAVSPAVPVHITGTTRIVGALTPANESDYYKMTLASAGAIRMEMFDSTGDNCSGNAATKITVYGSNGTTTVTSMNNDGNSTTDSQGGISTCAALVGYYAAGVYYVRIQPSLTTTTVANYQLEVNFLTSAGSEVEANETTATATPITTGPAMTNLFIAGDHPAGTDTDFYKFDVPAGRSVRIESFEGVNNVACGTNSSTSPDHILTLYKPDGTTIAVTDGDDGRGYCSQIDGTGLVGTTAPRDTGANKLPAGTYYLRMTSYSTSNSAYNLFQYRIALTIR